MSINAVIIDDEELARVNLSLMLKNYFKEVNIVEEFSNALDANTIINSGKIDVVFIDINMPIINGLDYINSLTTKKCLFILVTAQNNFGLQALKLGVFDYLLKPLSISEVQTCLNKITDQLNKTNNQITKISLPVANGFILIQEDELLFIEGDSNYSKVFLKNGEELLITKTLKFFEHLFKTKNFVRISKKHIVNITNATKFTKSDGGIVTIGKHELSVSKVFSSDFFKLIENF